MPAVFFTLAQVVVVEQRYSPTEVMTYMVIVLALVICLAVVSSILRRKFLTKKPDDSPPLGFTLKDLREMHKNGQLSDEEFAVAEEKALSRAKSLYLGDDESDAAQAATESDGEIVWESDEGSSDAASDPDGLNPPGGETHSPDKTGEDDAEPHKPEN